MIRVNYWAIRNAETGENVLDLVGNKAEVRSAFKEYKKELRAQGYKIVGRFDSGVYVASKGNEKILFLVESVDYIAQDY